MAEIQLCRNGKKTPFGEHGKLHVDGQHIIDANGNICQLRGLSSHSMSYYPEYLNEELITQFADEYGIDIFRFALYSASADGVCGYADGTDELRASLEELIINGVKVCAELGIYALVDWHILLDYDPNMHTDSAIMFFKKMCSILKEYDNVIYEICNEPNKDTTWEQITNYANQVIPVIRSIDSDKIISVGTPLWSQRVDEAANAPLNFDNITYTLHFYAATHKQNLRDILIMALNKKLPVFVTEFGICEASGDGEINDKEVDAWLTLLDENKISYVLWNLSNKNESSAILKPSCKKISNFNNDDFSECGIRFLEYMKRK